MWRSTMKILRPVVVVLVAGFMVLAVWRNPAVAAQDVGTVVGNVATFLQDVIQRLAEFVGNLGG
jgi:hypothetical protein